MLSGLMRTKDRSRGHGGIAPPVFPDPSSLILWHDTAAGHVTTPGGSVTALLDQSTSASNATQATVASEPVHSSAAFGAFPGITFDGSNDYLIQALSAPSGAKTIGISFKLTSTPAGSTFTSLMRLKTAGGNFFELLAMNFGGYLPLSFLADFPQTGAVASGVQATLDTNPHRLIVAYNGGANNAITSYQCWLDGNPLTVAASSTVNAAGGTSAGCIMGRGTASAFEGQATPGVFFRGAVYSKAIAPADIKRLDQWLSNGCQSSPGWTKQVVCAGNSLTFGYPLNGDSQSYPGVMRANLTPTAWAVTNLGINGQTTPQMITAFPSTTGPLYNAARAKNVIVVWEGGNDILGGATARQAADHLWTYCDAAKAAGFYVIVLTIPKRADLTGASDTARAAANAFIVAEYATHANALADVAADAAFSNTGNPDYQADGVHYTAAGYAVVEGYVRPLVLAA